MFGAFGTIAFVDIEDDTAFITFDNWEVWGLELTLDLTADHTSHHL